MNLREGWIVAVVLLSASGARAGLAVPPHLISVGLQNSPLAQAGYLDATAYGADPKGLKDSTSAIQATINDAMKYAMTAYLPSGTYVVSRTLQGNAPFSSSGCVAETSIGSTGRWPESPSLVGPAAGPRPLIKLASTATGFDSASRPAPLIFFQLVLTGSNWLQTADCFYYAVIRDIDLDLGGHAGAIGIQFAAAQYSYMENISVNAKGAYAGIYGVPSVETNVNLSVTGGQYGIIPTTCCGISLVGVTLSDQVLAGLKLNNFGATAVTGFNITESEGSAVINSDWAQTSQGVLIDGQITLTNGSAPAVANGNNDFYMRNVYVKTPGAIVHSGSNKPIVAGAGTALVEEYSYTNATPTTENGLTTTSYTLLGGVLGQAELATVKSNVSTVPADLVTRHLPGPLPWFEDRGVVNAVGLGADPTGQADSTGALQKAIDSGNEVFVPRGDYKLSGTLQLKATSRFFGLPGYRSRFGVSSAWNPNNSLTYMIRSASTTTGATHLGDVWLTAPSSATPTGYAQSYIGGIEWEAGRSSIVRQVAVYLPWGCHCLDSTCSRCDTSYNTSAPRNEVHILGNGGGRWYGTQLQLEAHHVRNINAGFRAILAEGTTAPLTFYGANAEHPENEPFVEFRNAKNVRFFGSKSEGAQYEFDGSSNVMFAGHSANGDNLPQVVVSHSTDVVVANTSLFFGQGDAHALLFQYIPASGPTQTIAGNDQLSLFKTGTFNDAAFPYCGDRVCDGAENHANCPADCTATSSALSDSANGDEVDGVGCASAPGAPGGLALLGCLLAAAALRGSRRR